MYIYDYRLGKILSDIRVQRAQAQRQARAIARNTLRVRIGRLLITAGERLAHGKVTPEGEPLVVSRRVDDPGWGWC